MATILADTNILLRLGDPNSPLHQLVNHAVNQLKTMGDIICIVPQNLYEFYTVATRPSSARGGLGLTPEQAEIEINRLQALFNFLPDTADVFTEWLSLVSRYSVSGVQAHDARLVAAMRVHSLPSLLTFNVADFTRYDQIDVLDPATI